ncbi:hypothetical protein ACE3MQ_24845 [Paenibacillus lentus]|uniref:hypothetical protein n=1 Tax=Paenibacillus lentus TaxID=1338368 RepID=UPI00365C0448
MLKECINLLIDEKTSVACDDYLSITSDRYERFISIIQNATINTEDTFHLENLYLLQTREAIDYAYKLAFEEALNIVANTQCPAAHFDHILTTQAMNNTRISR